MAKTATKKAGPLEKATVSAKINEVREKYKTVEERLEYCLHLDQGKRGEWQALSAYFNVFYGLKLDWKNSQVCIPFSALKDKTNDGNETVITIPSFLEARTALRDLVADKNRQEDLELNMSEFKAEKAPKATKKTKAETTTTTPTPNPEVSEDSGNESREPDSNS